MSGDRTGQSGSIYSFGETELAAERLRLVSEVFDPTSEAFLFESVRTRPRLALELGCGPGFTTRLLSRTARPDRTEIKGLADELDRLTNSAETGRIAWQMRQIPLRRHPA